MKRLIPNQTAPTMPAVISPPINERSVAAAPDPATRHHASLFESTVTTMWSADTSWFHRTPWAAASNAEVGAAGRCVVCVVQVDPSQ